MSSKIALVRVYLYGKAPRVFYEIDSMKSFSSMLLLLVFSLVCFGAEEIKLSPSDQLKVDKAIDGSLADARKSYDAYLSVLGKAQERAIKELDALKVDGMKKGNLPLANAAEAKIKEIKDGSLKDRITEKLKTDSPSEKQDLSIVVLGEWGGRKDMKDNYTFNSDGSISWGKPEGHYKGTWKISKSKLVLTWKIPADWGEQTLTFSKDLTTLTCVAEEWSISKIK
jgi:hypothetical protein